jgi:hypothetical protein
LQLQVLGLRENSYRFKQIKYSYCIQLLLLHSVHFLNFFWISARFYYQCQFFIFFLRKKNGWSVRNLYGQPNKIKIFEKYKFLLFR